MTQLHFRDLPPRPITVVFEFLDEDGNAEVFDSFVVGDPASKSDAEVEACDGQELVSP